jgi:DNA-binding response OmpR family regulator
MSGRLQPESSDGEIGMDAPLIALVDDDPTILDLLGEVLRDAGYRTRSARSGQEGDALLGQMRPALLILDIRMEEPQAGIGLLRALRAQPERADLPVIVCSADVPFLRAHGEVLRALGCETIAKPFDLDDLLARVSAAIGTERRAAS